MTQPPRRPLWAPGLLWSVLCVGGLLQGGCFGGPALTALVCGDGADELDSLRLVVLDDGRVAVGEGVRDLITPEGRRTLPLRLRVPTASTATWLAVEGLFQGVEELRFEVRLTEPEPLSAVPLAVQADCLGVQCVVGQTCLGGRCVPSPEVGTDLPCGADE
ncbi:MAG: hypothetical protein ACFCGT_03245 [Sandaracinaceae bacterium]